MTEPTDITVEILRQIRDEIVCTRTELRDEIASTRTELSTEIASTRAELSARIDQTNTRLTAVETTLLDLAEQQRFVVRHLGALTARDRKLEDDVDELRGRVEAIERRLPSG